MSLEPSQLAERIRGEVPDLDRELQRAVYAWEQARRIATDQDIYAGYAAAALQGFYTGLERVFQLVAVNVDERMPSNETWHLTMIRQMAGIVPERRPSVISEQSLADLDEFRKFRHAVRHVYVSNLDAQRLKNLFSLLPALWPRLQAELMAFAAYLDASSSPPDSILIETPPE